MVVHSEGKNAYQDLVHTDTWVVLDRAVTELVRNSDLCETTAHEYVVGYLCHALATSERGRPKSREEMRQVLHAYRKEMQAANVTNRDLEAELLAERREEAAGE